MWNQMTGSITDSSPAIADDVVFVGSDGGSVYAFNALTGAMIWKFTTNGAIDSSPAVAYGVVYVGSNDGKVYAFGTYQGPQPSITPSPSPPQTPSPTASPSPSSSPTPTQSPTISPVPSVPEFQSFGITLLVVTVASAATIIFKRMRRCSDDNNVYALNARNGRQI